MKVIRIGAHQNPTAQTSLDLLMRIADGERYPDHVRLQAIIAMGDKLRIPTAPPEDARTVLLAVMHSEDVPIELRARAAKVLLQPPAGTSGTNPKEK